MTPDPATGRRRAPVKARREPGGRPVARDAVLVAAHLAWSAAALLLPDADGPAGWGLAAVAARVVLQGICILLADRRPVWSAAGYAVLVLVPPEASIPADAVGLLALTYVWFRDRSPGRAAGLVLAVLGAVVVSAALPDPDGPPTTGAEAAIGATVLGALVAFVGLVAWTRRVVAAREVRDGRRRAEREREAALAAERSRIAEELNEIVVRALQRVAELATGLRDRLDGPSPAGPLQAFAEVQVEARRALSAMRRALVVLRAGQDGSSPADGAAPVGPRQVPVPTSSGTALVLAGAAAIWGVDRLLAGIGSAPTGDPSLDLLVAWATVDAEQPVAVWPVLTQVVLLVTQLLGLAWWRSAPFVALALAGAGSLGAMLNGSSNLIADATWMITVYGLGAGAPAAASAAALVVVGGALTGMSVLTAPSWTALAPPQTQVLGAVAGAVLVASVWGLAAARRRIRLARDRATTLRVDRETRLAVEQERHRIARELHDVVAHFVSAVAVQAGAARAVADHDPATVLEAVAHIEDYGHRIGRALPELVGLSPPTEIVALTRRGVEGLLAPLRTVGLPVTVEVRGEPPVESGDAELFAQRILLEAVSNVRRHAGCSPTHVVVEHGHRDVLVVVTDGGPVGPPVADEGAGLGLVGMRERAELLGGDLRAGPTGDGGWRVVARLPRVPVDGPRPR